MALKKSQLYSKLWQSCDELRGGMDASQYKDYVLTLLFVKYVSDKYAADPAALIDVPPGARFADMVAAKGDKEIGDRINKVIGKLAEANDSLKGAINVADFNDEEKLGKGKEMVDRLSKLVAIFEGLNVGRNRAKGDDLLGDAYEYLMRHFATESGKSKGQFYTPAEVSRVMAQVIGLDKATSATQTIFDPTCGSGSLLLKAHDLAKGRTGHDLTIYGQEMDNTTSALARMNMVLHDCPTAEIWPANSLSSPHFKDERNALRLKAFDYAVANPPLLAEELDQRPGPGQRPVRPLRDPPARLGRAAAEERRLRLPAAHPDQPEEHRPQRGEPPRLAELRAGQETGRVHRVHRRARADVPGRAQSRRALRGAHESSPAALGSDAEAAELGATRARGLGCLSALSCGLQSASARPMSRHTFTRDISAAGRPFGGSGPLTDGGCY
jgi:hypothetical protein